MISKKYKISMGIVLSGFLFMAAGCGGGSDGIPGGVNFIPSARVCSLDMPISGKELTDNISWSGSDGCAFGSGPNNSYIATFGGLSAEWIIAITVNNIVPGDIGTSKSASVRIRNKADNRVWETTAAGCTVNVADYNTSNNFIDGVIGSGVCSSTASPITSTGATDPLSLGDFDFISFYYG